MVGDSIAKYLRGRESLSSKEGMIKSIVHSGSSKEDMMDNIKAMARKTSALLIMYTGTNNLKNGVNMMKEVKKLVRCIRDKSKKEDIKDTIIKQVSIF